MDRVFLDANVLFSAAYKPTSRLRVLWTVPDVLLLSSFYAVAEAEVNLERIKASAVEELHALRQKLLLVERPKYAALPADVALPEKDRPILGAAISAKASHLLNGDKLHFGPLFGRRIEGVLILPSAEYLNDINGLQL